MIQKRPGPAIAAAAARIEVLATSTRGLGNLVYKDGAAWVSMSNSTTGGSAVMKTPLPLQASSRWTEVPLGACALARSDSADSARTPAGPGRRTRPVHARRRRR